jgi:hypothetical protein
MMGKRNRTAVITYWARLLVRDSRALLVAYSIADVVPDGQDEFWGGQKLVAEWIGVWTGGEEWTDTTRRAARRALQSLVEAGLLEQTAPSTPTDPARYRCHWKEPPIWPTRRP